MLCDVLFLTVLSAGGVGEVHHSLFLQGSGCDGGVNQCFVKHQLLHRKSLASVQTPHYYSTAAVVLVLVAHIDDNTSVLEFHWLLKHVRQYASY